jgi:hypothetical protein
VGHGMRNFFTQEMKRISENCLSLLQLYKRAFSENGKRSFPYSFSVVLDVKDPFIYTEPKDRERISEWRVHHQYSYELAVPKDRSGSIFKIMQEDLFRYFGLNATVLEEKCTMIELFARPGPNLLLTKGGIPTSSVNYDTLTSIKRLHVFIRNKPFDTLTNIIWRSLPKAKFDFEDRSYYRELGNIDIEFTIDLDSKLFTNSLWKAMARYNLGIVNRSKEIDILVLSDKK